MTDTPFDIIYKPNLYINNAYSFWTKEQEEVAKNKSLEEASHILGRSRGAIKDRLRKIHNI